MARRETKRQREERAEILRSLSSTADVEPDVDPPSGSSGGLTTGWSFCCCAGYDRVEESCSSATAHAHGRTDKVTSRDPIKLFSDKSLALAALRRAIEHECGKRLKNVDDMIAAEKKRHR